MDHKDLKKQLFNQQDDQIKNLDELELKEADIFSDGYKSFLNESKTERECIRNILKKAKDLGFSEFNDEVKYEPGDKIYYLNKEKLLILSVIGKDKTKNGVLMSIAHVDSPRFDLKPNPVYESKNLAYFDTHYYGGIRKYHWLAIPLSLHGRIVKKNGEHLDICIGEDDNDPKFCITDLLPHLASEQSDKPLNKAFSGENLNVLIGSRPLENDIDSNLVKLNILKILNEKYGIIESDFTSAELELVPAFKSTDIGFDRSLIGAYGQDDRVCAYPLAEAIFNCTNPHQTIIGVFCDKEETGSNGTTGMKSEILKYFISELALIDNEKPWKVISKSKCLSADVSAAFDPMYSDVFEEKNTSYLNKGVAICKYTGSGGKYGTSDASAEFVGEIRKILDDNKIIWQIGELGKVDAGGGGTIAMYMANMNIDVLDMGVPVMSMHSPFEVTSKLDIFMLFRAFKAFFESNF